VLEGYIANLQNQFVRVVWRSKLPIEDKLILLALNSVKGWLRYDRDTTYTTKPREVKVQDWHRYLAKRISKHLLSKSRRRRFSGIFMHLVKRVAKLEPMKENKAKGLNLRQEKAYINSIEEEFLRWKFRRRV
jgi:hypothetical protein